MVYFYRVLLASVAALIATGAAASETNRINISGVKTVSVAAMTSIQAVSASKPVPVELPIEIGGTLPLKYMMVVNLKDYDLPRPQNGWVYFEVKDEIYRVDLNSRESLEMVAYRIR